VKHRLTVVCLVAVVLAAGCRIGGSDRVEEVDSNLLSGLDEPTTSTSTTVPATVPDTVDSSSTTMPLGSGPASTTTDAQPTTTVASEPIRLYFIEGSELVAIDVEIPENLSMRRRLALLEDGLPRVYADTGVRTALLPGLISGMTMRGSNGVTVDLDAALFAGVDDSDQRLLIGQIVLTLVDQPGIDRVSFSRDGQPLQVPLRDNTLGRPGEAVGRNDYEVLLSGSEPES
jgi:hypothetical protein